MLLWASVMVAASALVVWAASRAAERWPRAAFAVSAAIGIVALLAAIALGGDSSSYPISDLFVLCAAMAAAIVLARAAGSWDALSVLFVVAAVADTISTAIGPTRFLVSAGGRGALGYLSITAPYDGQLVAVVGLADLAFLGAAFLVFARLRARGLLAVLPWLGLETALFLAVSASLGPIPALPFIAAGVLLARRLSRPAPGQPNDEASGARGNQPAEDDQSMVVAARARNVLPVAGDQD